jgi:ATP-dependent 26S proteasome regulatory subunit
MRQYVCTDFVLVWGGLTLVHILPPEADSSISLLGENEKPNITYQVRGCDVALCQLRLPAAASRAASF